MTRNGLNPPRAITGRRVLAAIIIPALLAAFFLFQDYLSYSYISGQPFPIWGTLVYEILVFYVWAALLPFILWFAQRDIASRRSRLLTIALHAPVGVLVALLHSTVTIGTTVAINLPDAFAAGIPPWLHKKILAGAVKSLIQYCIILGAHHALVANKRYREQKILSAELETQLAVANLQSLTMQLQPHFLFNTLHAISSLMNEDIQAARRMVSRLSELLRQTLERVGVQRVTLRDELAFLSSYLEIEQTRFQDRLLVSYAVDQNLLDASVPNLVLQPLVENAIRHGILPRPEGGRLEISARMVGVRLRLEVSDDGVGLGSNVSGGFREGMGLSNIRKRLQQLYGKDGGLRLSTRHGGGMTAAVEIPFESGAE